MEKEKEKEKRQSRFAKISVHTLCTNGLSLMGRLAGRTTLMLSAISKPIACAHFESKSNEHFLLIQSYEN